MTESGFESRSMWDTKLHLINAFVIKKEMAKHLPCAVDGCHVEGMMRF